jgi:multicomponent K+:H+ antiporter subunit A
MTFAAFTVSVLPLLPWFGAAMVLLCRSRGAGAVATLAAVLPALALLLALLQAPTVFGGEVVRVSAQWLPQAGLMLGFRLDGLSLLFVLLILGMGLLIILYARFYLSPRDSPARFHALLLLFMGAMLGVVTADNLLFMVVFWEATSLSSFLLIGFWSGRAEARRGARMALTITGGGGLALLGGVVLIGHVVGSVQVDDVLAAGELLRGHALYPLILVLVLLGAFTKSAQFPFHFWLPHAMAAPTPVSAYLHSATMVKVGVFLLARLHPALSGTDLWFYCVGGTGAVTLLVGAWIALFKTDIKALLAYSTISHLGLMTLLLGMGTQVAAVVAMFHLINHALFKAPLFMTAGIVDHATHTRDIRRLGGLWRPLPWTMAAAFLPAAAMAGMPLMNGYLSKKLFFAKTLVESPLQAWGWLLPAVAVVAGAFSVAYTLRLYHGVFFGAPQGSSAGEPLEAPHEAPLLMLLPLALLAALCLLVGLAPDAIIGPLLAVASTALLGGELPEYTLSVSDTWVPMFMSLAALAAGGLLYLLRAPLFRLADGVATVDARSLFESGQRALVAAARGLVQLLENGSLQRYVGLLVGLAVVVGVYALLPLAQWRGPVAMGGIDAMRDVLTVAVLIVLMLAGLATAVLHRQRMLALVLMGVSGLMVTLVFERFSAPDLALTQLSVEVMAVVILMLALSFLPQHSPVESTALRRGRDVLLALMAGGGVTMLAWAVLTRPYESISGYFLENSLPLGGGSNVVNVILVDFRGFDTLGEIAVLGIAALAIFVLTRSLKTGARMSPQHGVAGISEAHPLFLQVISRPMLPIALLVAAYIFLRGHNLPGGGFIAGLIAAVALTLQYVANGLQWTHARRRTAFRPVVAAGLMVAGLTGMGSWLFGHPFLSSWTAHAHIPLIGEIEIATAMAFDLGVFFTVVGATMLVLSNIGKLMTVHGPGEEVG